MSRRRTLLPAALVLLAVLAASAVLVVADAREPTTRERVTAVAEGLRCPTCVAESVADSNAPIAQSMRQEIRAQLREGRSPEEITAWFQERYGDRVLLDPPAEGLGLVVAAAPPAAVLGGAVLVGVVLRRRRTPATPPPQAGPIGPGRVVAVAGAVLVAGAAVPAVVWAVTSAETTTVPAAAEQPAATVPGQGTRSAAQWAAVARDLADQGDYRAAVRAWRQAQQADPASGTVRTRLGFDLLRSGRPAAAVAQVRAVAGTPGPDRPLALLVLGLAQREQGRPGAEQTLRRFLDLVPDHPAAPEVRRLLAEP